MTEKDALEHARTIATQGRFHTTKHCRDQCAKRAVQLVDIVAAMQSASTATYSDSERTWRLSGGKDLDGDSLEVVVAFDDDFDRVVTVI